MSVAEALKSQSPEQVAAQHPEVEQSAAAKRRDVRKALERERREINRELDAEERPQSDPPEVLTLRQRLARPRSEVKWRIGRVQGAGHRVLLAAQFKAGKTTLAANVARSVLDGDLFLDSFTVEQISGAVALLDFEMSPNQLDEWYAAQQIDNDDRLVVIPLRGAASSFDIIDPERRRYWVEQLKAHRVQYLILDCLRPVLDALGLNEHTEAGVFLTAFDALLREAGIPEALVIQHMGHKNERARGDSRLLDWPDVGWTLVRESDDDPASPRYFKAYGRDVDIPETQLTYDESSRRLTLVNKDAGGGSRADVKVEDALRHVAEFVSKSAEPPSGRQIADAVKGHNLTQKAIRKAIHRGVELGVLKELPGRNGGHAYESTQGDRPLYVPVAAAGGGL
jgi:hypothetical protein